MATKKKVTKKSKKSTKKSITVRKRTAKKKGVSGFSLGQNDTIANDTIDAGIAAGFEGFDDV